MKERWSPGDRQPVIESILGSRAPGLVVLRWALVAAITLVGLLSLKLSGEALTLPHVYRKDFIQEYLLARAVLAGVNPYAPLSELAAQFLGHLPNPVFPHPTPHPPPVAVISLPLGLLTYEQAAVAWFLFEMVCLVVSVHLLLRESGWRPGVWRTLFVSLLVLGWNPFLDDLTVGQLMVPLLVLLLLCWRDLRAGRAIRGGVFLGCVIALKLLAWPIVLWLVLRRNWRAAGAAIGTVLAANALAVVLVGLDQVIYYYTVAGPVVSALYRAADVNISVWTIGWRVFEGTGATVVMGLAAPPLVAAPEVAGLVSLVIPLVWLGMGLALASRARSLDAAFGILVCVSVLVNPVAWAHYLTLTAIPLVYAIRRVLDLRLLRGEAYALLVSGLLLALAPRHLRGLALLAASPEPGGTGFMVPFLIGLLPFIPTLAAMVGLLWLVWRLDRAESLYARQGKSAPRAQAERPFRTHAERGCEQRERGCEQQSSPRAHAPRGHAAETALAVPPFRTHAERGCEQASVSPRAHAPRGHAAERGCEQRAMVVVVIPMQEYPCRPDSRPG